MYDALVQIAAQEPAVRYQPGSIPAPVFGWNTRDPVDAMDPRFAVQLDNFFPFNGYCQLRGGARVWTNLGAATEVGGVFVWRDGQTEKFIATAGGNVYEVFNGGNTQIGTGFTISRWNSILVQQCLMLFNGTDAPQQYNGTTLTPALWTGPANINNLFGGFSSKQVTFVFENFMNGFWHTAKGVVKPSALTYFDLDQILPDGGEMVAGGTMTVDGGDGPDDYTCFLSSSGWMAVYRGEDPGQASEWSIVGRYRVGEPLAFGKAILEMAGDLIVLTTNGYISMRKFFAAGGDISRSYVFNDNIQPEVVRQTLRSGDTYGWQAIVVPHLTLALFNVPQGGKTYDQHVVNTQTGAWARFRNWNGVSWVATRSLLLYGDADGNVVQAASGDLDLNNLPVIGRGLSAYNRFGVPTTKVFQAFRTVLQIPSNVTIQLGLAVDFEQLEDTLTNIPSTPADSALWDSSEWDDGQWEQPSVNYKEWIGAGQVGYSAAINLAVSSSSGPIDWYSTDVIFTPGTFV